MNSHLKNSLFNRFGPSQLVIRVLLILLAAMANCFAQEVKHDENATDTIGSLQAAWHQVQQHLHDKNLGELNNALTLVAVYRNEGGFSALEEYSVALTEEGMRRSLAGDIEGADFFLRRARALSPDSSYVILKSLSLARAVGVSSALSDLIHALVRLPHSPTMLSEIAVGSIYPILWALTIGLYLVFVMHCSFWCADILRSVAAHFPLHVRGIAAPIVTSIFLSVPIFMGPLVCLVAWSLLIWICDRKKRWAPIMAGILLALWGTVIPIRERVMGWLSEPGMKATLNLQGGSLGGLDRFEIEKFVRRHPQSGAAWYALAQLFRKESDLDSAEKALVQATKLLGDKSWILAERATQLAILGHPEESVQKFAEAEAAGLQSAELYFNWSKVAFDSLDTAAVREKLLQAEKIDPVTTEILKQRENQLGLGHVASYADVPMPLSTVFSALFAPRGVVGDNVSNRLLDGFTPGALVWAGIAMCLFGLIPSKSKRRQKTTSYFAEYVPGSLVSTLPKLIPGGSWIVSEKPVRAFLAFSLVVLIGMPLAGWPWEASTLFQEFPEALIPYAVAVGLIAIGLSFVSFVLAEE